MIYIRLKNLGTTLDNAIDILENSGLKCCCCCKFYNCIALETCLYDCDINIENSYHIHGVYDDEIESFTAEESLEYSIKDFKDVDKEVIECSNLDEFIKECKRAWKI